MTIRCSRCQHLRRGSLVRLPFSEVWVALCWRCRGAALIARLRSLVA